MTNCRSTGRSSSPSSRRNETAVGGTEVSSICSAGHGNGAPASWAIIIACADFSKWKVSVSPRSYPMNTNRFESELLQRSDAFSNSNSNGESRDGLGRLASSAFRAMNSGRANRSGIAVRAQNKPKNLADLAAALTAHERQFQHFEVSTSDIRIEHHLLVVDGREIEIGEEGMGRLCRRFITPAGHFGQALAGRACGSVSTSYRRRPVRRQANGGRPVATRCRRFDVRRHRSWRPQHSDLRGRHRSRAQRDRP